MPDTMKKMESRSVTINCEFHGKTQGTEVFDSVLNNWFSEEGCVECGEDEKKGERARELQCEKHGLWKYKEKYLETLGMWMGPSRCAKCVEEERVATTKRDKAIDKARRESVFASRIEANTRAADIPNKFKSKTLSNYTPVNPEAERMLKIARRYVEKFEEQKEVGRSLMFLGTVGTGKTHLAMGIANALLLKGYSVRQTSVNRLSLEIRATFSKKSENNEADIIREYVRPDLLIIDEIGVGRGTDAEALALHDVLSGRYDQGLPTIITSNLDSEALMKTIGERLFSRLKENGGVSLTFTWGDYRRQGNGS